MQEIDGSMGGGQVVRTAVTLSALSGEAVRIEDVRGGREEPGLRPQHLAAVEAAAALSEASVEGDEQGAETLVFEPGDLEARDVAVDVGTAGSVALVCDTLLPLATELDEPASVTVTGGTDVEWAPPIDYLRRTKLPLLAEYGLDADLAVASRGFYPVGEGEATLTLRPSSLSPLGLTDRGALRRVEVYSVADEELREPSVAERQAAAVAEAIDVDVSVATLATYDDAACPGSVVVLSAVYEGGRAGFSALGEAGKPAEDVGEEAVEAFRAFHEDGTAAVDRHLADQLLVPLALAGGEVLAPGTTPHVETNRAVLAAFGHEVSIDDRDDGVLLEG
jgi:RNA 3'-terminal phosphate cyclase (ATP)